jgi:hypothetical protein
LKQWLTALPDAGLTDAQVSDAWQKVDETAGRRDAHDAAREIPVRTWTHHFHVVVGCVCSFIAGLVLTSTSIRVFPLWMPFAMAEAAAIVLGVVTTRWPPLRRFAVAWTFGCAGTLVLLAGAAASTMLG